MKKAIRRSLFLVSTILMIAVLIINVYRDINKRQKNMVDNSLQLFEQIDRLIGNNEVGIDHGDVHNLVKEFGLFTGMTNSSLFLISEEDGIIKSSSREGMAGKHISEYGLNKDMISQWGEGFYFKNSSNSWAYGVCAGTKEGVLLHAISKHNLYDGIVSDIISMVLYYLVIVIVSYLILMNYLDDKIVSTFKDINKSLQVITAGDLDAKVEANSTPEFVELSGYINTMVAQLKKDVQEDLLTGLYCRRAFYGEIEKVFDKPVPNLHAAIFMIDADNLKKVNDKYGHSIGDAYIKKVADLLRNMSAPHKLVARLGGDEFAVLVYGAANEAELWGYLQELYKLRRYSKIDISAQEHIRVGFSVGMAIFPEDGDNYHTLLKIADENMYNDKIKRRKARAKEKV